MKFQVFKDAAGKYRFRLRADNEKIVAVGEAYEKRAGCLNGIKSIQKNCKAAIADTTIPDAKAVPNPKYEVYRDTAGEFRFHLKAGNGQIIANSEGYETKEACLDGINIVKTANEATIEDATVIEAPAADLSSIKTPEEPAKDLAENDRKDEMIEELKKIRASVEQPPAPVVVPPKGLWNEFKDFLSKYKILGLAVAFVLGLYLGTLVQALVKDFIMPLIGLALPGISDLATFKVPVMNQVFSIGDFLVALITFIIVAFIVFIIVKVMKRWKID